MGGWVKTHRSLFEHEIWLEKPFSKGQAWVDLWGNANHTPDFFMKRGQRVDIARGQIGWSQIKMQKRWGWSQNKVKRFLLRLKDERMVDFNTDDLTKHLTTVVTICNYKKYQDKQKEANEQTDDLTNEQTDDKQEVKNLRSKETTTGAQAPQRRLRKFTFNDEQYNLAGRMATPVKEKFPGQKIDPDQWADAVRMMVEIDNRQREEIIKVWAWIKDDDFWFDKIKTPMKLRKRDPDGLMYFDKITTRMKANGNGSHKQPNQQTTADRIRAKSIQIISAVEQREIADGTLDPDDRLVR